MTDLLEEVANVNIQFVFFPSESANYQRQLSLMASTGTEILPDVLIGFTLDYNMRNEYGDSGYFKDLTELVETNAPHLKEAMEKHLTDKDIARMNSRWISESGCKYAMPEYFNVRAIDDLTNKMYINKQWLDTLEMEMPTTVDEMYEVLTAFKEMDPNDNGKADEIPMFGGDGFVMNAYTYWDPTYIFNVDANGKLYCSATTQEYREGLKTLNKWKKEGLFSDLSFSVTANSEKQQLITPSTNIAKVGVFIGHPAIVMTYTSTLFDQYAAFRPLKAVSKENETNREAGCVVLHNSAMSFNCMITKDCVDDAAAMRLLDAFYVDDVVTTQRHGKKGEDWVEEVGTNIFGDDDAYITVKNAEVFFNGNRTWCGVKSGIATSQNYFAVEKFENKTDEEIGRMLHELMDYMQDPTSRYPHATCSELVYSADDYEKKTEYAAMVNQYVSSERNRFILGQIDPNKDSDWNKYLEDLEKYGLKDYTELMQRVYDYNDYKE